MSSRKYMLERHCIRCGRLTAPTPYLAKQLECIMMDGTHTSWNVLDLGCGNGRNSEYLKTKGFQKDHILSLDMKPDYGWGIDLDKGVLPVFPYSVNLVLLNYVLMFIKKTARMKLLREVDRVSRDWGRVIIEMYPAKDSCLPSEAACLVELDNIKRWFLKKSWAIIHDSKLRCVLQKGSI